MGLLRQGCNSMDTNHFMVNTFLIFSAILPWELSIGPPWLEREKQICESAYRTGTLFLTRKAHLSKLPDEAGQRGNLDKGGTKIKAERGLTIQMDK